MYARQLSFRSTPENRSEIEALADRAFGLMQSMNGFVAAHFLVSDDETAYGSFSLWRTREDAEAAADRFREATMPIVQKLATDAPAVMQYEVYEPKS